MEELETLKNFDEKNLPDLDTVVLGALEFFKQKGVKLPELPELVRPLVVGSGNAAVTGRVLFGDTNALYADESTYEHILESYLDVTEAVIISASGGKHAIEIAKALTEKNITTHLITNNPSASAAKFLDASNVYVFPKVREPYTYNTSTYMSMLLAQSGESPKAIHSFIVEEVSPCIPDTLSEYSAFFITLPEQFEPMRAMLTTKFDELFGPEINGRVFTLEQTKHAKTVVSSEKEYFISIGEPQTIFGEKDKRIHIPLPKDAGPAAMMAVGYYVIGHIQKQHPSYFKDNISRYVLEASELFGHTIPIIVE